MKNHFSLRSLAAALLIGASGLALEAAVTVDSVITSGLFEPYGVAVEPDGTFYLTDGANHRVLRVPTGLTTPQLLAGQIGSPGTNNGVADAAQFNLPQGIVLARGGLVVADSENQLIRFVSFNGNVTNLAGAPGVYGLVNAQGTAARFRYPLGLATDSDGNIYIADSQNNAIRKLDINNNVTTVASGFFQPAAIAVGDNGDLWVTDTRRHCIKRVSTNGTVTIMAGIPNVFGATDSSIATNALFSNPRGLLWLGGTTGLLITDSGNHTIRRLYFNTNFNSYSVTTFAGTPGESGTDNGPALEANFNSPVGLGGDTFGGGFLVADKGNSQIRRVNTGAVQPPVPQPAIGWVDFVLQTSGYVTQLRPVVSAVFNNDVIIAILGEFGTQTYFTSGATPSNPFEDTIPEPGAGVGNTPPAYRDGQPASSAPETLLAPAPDITIKAIGTATGRRSSSVTVSRFIFQAGNPLIVGDNAASFKVQNVTTNAEMWYTWDGSDPTNNPAGNPGVFGPVYSGDFISFNLSDSNRIFKIRAFKAGYRPSDLVVKEFSPSNFVANTLSLGFPSGEASSVYVAAAGQRFYAPVTLTALPGQLMYSLQFNVVATNLTGDPIDPTQVGFQSMLMAPIAERPGFFRGIPPAMALTPTGPLTSLLIPDFALNLLAVGWIERAGYTNLYDTLSHDLIKHSQAHDNTFDSANGKVIVGGYSFVVPATASTGQTYQITLGRASATSDGIGKNVYVRIPTNGAVNGVGGINGIKTVTVGSIPYLVGDPAPFRWFNAGDFGDGNLLNNDVLQTFQSAIYFLNSPPPGSDFFDTMDSSDGTVNDLFFGNIDQITAGDGILAVDDVYVTFRRSLDPSLKWYVRYWEDGLRKAQEVPNSTSFTGPAAPSKAKSAVTLTGTPTVGISADDIVAAPGSTVQVPVRVHITGGLPIRIAMLSVTVEPLDGAPGLTQPITISPAGGLGAPTFNNSKGADNLNVAWLNDTANGVSGDAVLGTVTVQIPASAGPNAAYRVRFNHFSASENGIALFRSHIRDGVVSTTSRTNSTLGDGISDLWRLRFFGSASSALSVANADPDHDSVSNFGEFIGGTNPQDANSVLRVNARTSGGGVKLSFPTGLGRTYIIECASEPNGPWTAVSTNAGDGVPREFLDTSSGRKFYRVRAQ
jgi:sugar lactone lactonase YvrE